MGLGRLVLGLLAASSLTISASAVAADPKPPLVVIRSGSLSSALHELARRTGVELLFDEASVRGLTARGLRGRMTVRAALDRLLGGTGLRWRRAASGAYVIERRAAPPVPVPAPAEPEAPAPEPVAIPEILVTGKRTQNADIRRRENDIQPYNVVTGRRIIQAHRDNLDQYFRSRVTQNTQVFPPSLLDDGETVSQIDLRGLGEEGTLVLLDGRRLPGIPDGGELFRFRQADINAVPLHAIDRLETLTGTAGGIHGFGALGGVVNIILKRDYRGLELHGTAGLSSRGDVPRLGLEGRLGFTPDSGRTEVMVYLSHARTDPLLVDERDYVDRNVRETHRIAPRLVVFEVPERNSVGVFSFTGQPLVLKPAYGGTALGSDHSFLPTGFAGTPADLAQALRSNAGKADPVSSPGEAQSEIGSSPVATAGLLNVRRRFGGRIEVFLDAVYLRNRGRHLERRSGGSLLMFPDSPANPFNQIIRVSFPVSGRAAETRVVVTTQRYTAGVIASLPLGWRGSAEATFGSASRRRRHSDRSEFSDPFLLYFGFGDPEFTPFGPWDEFMEAISEYMVDSAAASKARNRYREQSVRLAGPLFEAAGGPVTLTLLAELRGERMAANFASVSRGDVRIEYDIAPRSTDTRSLYAELRAPLGGPAPSIPFLRDLELQLAVRHDRQEARFSSTPIDAAGGTMLRHVFDGTAFTAGGKSSPARWLTLRASYATGAQPPPLDGLISHEEVPRFEFSQDPKRGNATIGTEIPFLLKSGGSPDIDNIRANTFSAGAVLAPAGEQGPRFSLDYSRIRRSGDLYRLSIEAILENEEIFPQRVTRLPMTDADRLAGYTGGPITMIDTRLLNGSRRIVETLDGRFDWPFSLLGGTLRPYAAATWQMRNEDKGLLTAALDRTNHRTGPLKWRANGGFDWTGGRFAFGANIQYFGPYRVYDAEEVTAKNVNAEPQGSDFVKSQVYLDLHASRSFRIGARGSGREATVDFGIVNLLDASPPRQVGAFLTAAGYSLYGDPRRRRFELVLSSRF